MEDSQGLRVTCTQAAALSAINDFIDADLHYRDTPLPALLVAREAAADTPMLSCYAAIAQLCADSKAAPALAQALIAPILQCATEKNERETQWLDVLTAWIGGDISDTITRLIALVASFPQDLVAARLGIVHCLMSGDHPHMLDFANCILSAASNLQNAAALSFVSFAYLENDDLPAAERYVRAALTIDPHLAWAQHNLAHIFATRDQFQAGLEALEGHEEDWEGLFIKAHCYWHKAIFHILLGSPERAIQIYNEVLIPMNWWHTVSLMNLLSLLMYLDLSGEKVLFAGNLLARLRIREMWGMDGLVDLMSVWALAKAGDVENARALAEMKRFKHEDIWKAGCSAMFLLSEGNRHRAGVAIKPFIDQFVSFGGSNEQRKALTDACLLTRNSNNSAV